MITFFRSIIHFQLGAQVSELQSFGSWILFEFLISLIYSLILLKYYHFKQYRFTFWVMTVYIAVSLILFVLFYKLLSTRDFTGYYISVILVLRGTGVLYAISLIFSQAGKRPWLKAAGVALFFLGLFVIFSFVLAISSVGARVNGTITTFEQWESVISSLVPVLFIMNFRTEKTEAQNATTDRQESFEGIVGLAGIIAMAATLYFVPRVALESIRLSDNPDYVSEGAKMMAEPFEARTYVNKYGATMRYRLMKPLDYDSTKKYPLVICLHGSSGCGTDNVRQIEASMPAQWLSKPENRTQYPSFIFVPQCPRQNAWGGLAEVPSVDSVLIESILAMEKEFTIDASRRYVTGNSLGGYGAWYLSMAYPDRFAAVVPICGGGDPGKVSLIKHLPIWVFHGGRDYVVPLKESEIMVTALRKAGSNVKFTIYPEAGHDSWTETYNNPELYEWFLRHKK